MFYSIVCDLNILWWFETTKHIMLTQKTKLVGFLGLILGLCCGVSYQSICWKSWTKYVGFRHQAVFWAYFNVMISIKGNAHLW